MPIFLDRHDVEQMTATELAQAHRPDMR